MNIHKDDLDLFDLIQPNISHGPWIAGGAPLKWYNGESVFAGHADVDVFCSNPSQFFGLKTVLNNNHFTVIHESDNAITFRGHVGPQGHAFVSFGPSEKPWSKYGFTEPISYRYCQIQLIRRKYYGTAKDVIDDFDFSVCQIATDGKNTIFGEHTEEDIKNKVFRQTCYNTHILKRAIKYITYGYKPHSNVIESIMHDTSIDNFEGILDYDFKF